MRRILGLTFDNLVKAAQQEKLALGLDAFTNLSFDQVMMCMALHHVVWLVAALSACTSFSTYNSAPNDKAWRR